MASALGIWRAQKAAPTSFVVLHGAALGLQSS